MCSNCANRRTVENRESGVVIDYCASLRVPIRRLGDVTKCTSFNAADEPYIFVKDAWSFHDLPDGSRRLMSDDEYYRLEAKEAK